VRENPKDIEHVNGSKLLAGKSESRWRQIMKDVTRMGKKGRIWEAIDKT
jgi:hypothetical protein